MEISEKVDDRYKIPKLMSNFYAYLHRLSSTQLAKGFAYGITVAGILDVSDGRFDHPHVVVPLLLVSLGYLALNSLKHRSDLGLNKLEKTIIAEINKNRRM